MFIGNFFIGSLKPAQQIELVQAKNLKKLQIFCRWNRLAIPAENELFDNPEGLESFLADYVQRYEIREELQQKLQQKMLLPQIKSYCDKHKDFCFSEPSAYCSFLTDYGVPAKAYKVTEKAESGLFDSKSEKLLLKMAAENRIFIRKNKIRFIKLYNRYPAEVEKYLFRYGRDIALTEDEEFEVVKENIRLIFVLKNIFPKTEGLLFEPENKDVLLDYADQKRFYHHDNEMKFLLLGKSYPAEVEKYLVQYGKDITLTEDEQFDVVKENIRLIFVLKNIFPKTESLLFELENKEAMLDYAVQRRFLSHDNEIKFLLFGKSYLAEVEKYLVQYDNDISLTEDEQFDVVKENIRLIFVSKNIFPKTEGLLFEPENKDVLLDYADQKRFYHHDNEIKFLLFGKRYPTEVEKYLSKYGKYITLTHEEELKVFGSNRNALMYLKVKNQDVYLDYVMPEMRRKRIPFAEKDIPMLMRLSYDNPLLLEEFIDYHGRFSPENEVELFFKAEANCRKKYISRHGIDLVNLIQHASDYGATQTEQEVLNKARFKEFSKNFPMLKKWNGYQIGGLGRCAVCREMSGENSCGVRSCNDVYNITQGLPIVIPVLLNIARRNYLLGAG